MGKPSPQAQPQPTPPPAPTPTAPPEPVKPRFTGTGHRTGGGQYRSRSEVRRSRKLDIRPHLMKADTGRHLGHYAPKRPIPAIDISPGAAQGENLKKYPGQPTEDEYYALYHQKFKHPSQAEIDAARAALPPRRQDPEEFKTDPKPNIPLMQKREFQHKIFEFLFLAGCRA